jgi:hypothetical protein
MLTLVHPAREGQGTDPPKRRRFARAPALVLQTEERRHLRAALHNLRRTLGSWARVASTLGVSLKAVEQASSKNSPKGGAALALLVARAAGTTVEALLRGTLGDADRCPTCGATFTGRRAAGGAS